MANQQHVEWLLKGKEAWNTRYCQEDGDLFGVDVDLSGADIREFFADYLDLPHMTPTPLAQYALYGANFTGADLWNADLTGARLMSAGLVSAKLIHANLTNADLEEADLTDAQL